MFRILRKVTAIALIGAVVYMGSVISDKQELSQQVLRLHVVANSDSAADQAVKLQVKDAVLAAVEQATSAAENKEDAYACVDAMLPELEELANSVLAAQGVSEQAAVTLEREEFPQRVYDTFTLPSGVYDSLRVTIGSGEGKNWWCVVFPGLCIPAATEQVEDVAAGAGFSQSLSGAITGNEQYQVRFYLLDVLGKIENFFHQS